MAWLIIIGYVLLGSFVASFVPVETKKEEEALIIAIIFWPILISGVFVYFLNKLMLKFVRFFRKARVWIQNHLTQKT